MNIKKYIDSLEDKSFVQARGELVSISGGIIKARLPRVSYGSLCGIYNGKGVKVASAEVVGFDHNHCFLMPYQSVFGISQQYKLKLIAESPKVSVGPNLLGRVVNGLGEPLDDRGPIKVIQERNIYQSTVNPLKRSIINEPMSLGVRAIDGFNTIGKGQRVALMAGSGVGKSVLMGMIAKQTKSDINVIALIGERGREVKDFIENILGESGLKRSIIVAVTSDQSPLVRMRGAFLATTIAEYFSDCGSNVLLVMDSLTRFAMAQREIGLSVGEPPTTKGYPPSVFYMLPQLLERAGSFESKGSITGLYTVLVEGDDMNDPIGDSVRSIVDGHIVLSRKLAERNHFPAIDVLQSASRVMRQVTSTDHQIANSELRKLMSIYLESEDLINIGAYQPGSNQDLDRSVNLKKAIDNFLQQGLDDKTSYNTCVEQLINIAGL